MTTDQVIEIKGLSKSFGNREILKDISFQVKEGEIFALLGPSGAGKTTLINILTGQLKATEGMACFLGKNTEQLKEQDYRQMGMMLDNLGLYERLSCYDNLQVFADIVGVPKQRVDEVLKRIGLWEARKSPAARAGSPSFKDHAERYFAEAELPIVQQSRMLERARIA